MFGANYVIPLEPRRYIPLFIDTSSITSLCGLLVSVKADYGIQRLSGVPLRESDVSIQWEQLEGPPPLEIKGDRTPTLELMLDPEDAADLKWRVWLDKGKVNAKYSDAWVRRTPIDVAYYSQSEDLVNPLINSSGSNVNLGSSTLVPTVTGIVPFALPDGELLAVPTSFNVDLEYPTTFNTLGHTATKVRILALNGEELTVATGNIGKSLLLPVFAPAFKLEWTITPYNKVKGVSRPDVVIVDSKVHVIPREYFPTNAYLNYFFTEKVLPPVAPISSTKTTVSKTYSLPLIRSYIDSGTPYTITERASNVYNKQRTLYTAKSCALNEDSLTAQSTRVNTVPSSIVVTRFDEINIGN